jgi:Iap family predicted aminopeptidase
MTMKVRAALIAGVSLVHGLAGGLAPAGAQVPNAATLAGRLGMHVRVLAADSMRGRHTPSDGLSQAVEYAARQLAGSGWQPAGDADSFAQLWRSDFTRLMTDASSLTVAGCGREASIEFGCDLISMYADPGEVRGPPVLLDSLSDRTGEDVGGRIVVMQTSSDPSGVAHRMMARARSAGAAGLVVVVPDDLDVMATPRLADMLTRMNHTSNGVPTSIVTLRGWSGLADVLETCDASTLVWRGPARHDSGMAANVVAVLPGSDPRLSHEYVVLSAHIDHNGVGPADASGDSIYNGADDNASGVAVALEVARALSTLPTRRSVIILLPSGEEIGMRGSAHFAANAPIPLERIVANVNVDGVGRAWQKDTVSAAGSEYSTLGPTVAAVANAHPELRLTVVPDQWPGARVFEFSDQISFARRGVPAIFFTSTGPDGHYHQPPDEPDTVDYDHLARVTQLVYMTLRAIADGEHPPAWDPEARTRIVRD